MQVPDQADSLSNILAHNKAFEDDKPEKVIEWAIDRFYPKLDIVLGPPFSLEVVPSPQVFATIGYLGVMVASFPLISAIAHFSIVILVNGKYNENLKNGGARISLQMV